MGRSIYGPLDEWFNPLGDADTGESAGHWREYGVGELVYMVEATGFRVIEKECRSAQLISKKARYSSILQKIVYATSDILTSTIFRSMADEAYVICQKPAT